MSGEIDNSSIDLAGFRKQEVELREMLENYIYDGAPRHSPPTAVNQIQEDDHHALHSLRIRYLCRAGRCGAYESRPTCIIRLHQQRQLQRFGMPEWDDIGPFGHIIFDQYLATVGGKTVTDKLLCNIDISLAVPKGYQYSIPAVNYRGSIYLDFKVTAEQTATYHYTGSQGQAKKTTTWTGPMDYDNYVVTDAFASPAWSQCNPNNAPIHIQSSLQLKNTANKSGTGVITTDSADSAFVQQYTIQWATC
ncbi:hypothetical protein HDV00_006350 [Rhizophlyctis rosea]|nr:hypothetical protein HDV00_006350 [Rhizophlyctis rosea]